MMHLNLIIYTVSKIARQKATNGRGKKENIRRPPQQIFRGGLSLLNWGQSNIFVAGC